jgi:integrase
MSAHFIFNPMAQKGVLTEAEPLMMSEFNKLVDGLHRDKEYKWELFCRLAFCCGYRYSDVQSLVWKEILGRDNMGRTERKTGKSRRIVFSESVADKIEELYTLLGGPNRDSAVIENPKTNKPYTIKHINQKLKVFRVKYRLKIGNFSTHTFRKTFGRRLYDESENKSEALLLLNKIFKHSSIEVTKTYIGLTQDEINDVFLSIKF